MLYYSQLQLRVIEVREQGKKEGGEEIGEN